MFREFVTIQDAIVAVTCMECSMQNSALLGSMNALHTRFPDDPQEEYSRQATLVLKRLNLEDMVSAINDVPSRGNESPASESGNSMERNFCASNESLAYNKVTGENLGNKEDRGRNSSTDEESEKAVTSDKDISVSNDSYELNSHGELTGVFPIQSSFVIGSDGFVGEDTSSEKTEPSICETTRRHEKHNGDENSGSGQGDHGSMGKISSKPSRFLANLRSTKDKESSSLIKGNNKVLASSSLEKSKKMIEMFAKKPLNAGVGNSTENNCQRRQVNGSRIFVTEELDDEELEVEWPSCVLSSLQTESKSNHLIGSLRGRENTV